MCEPTKRALCCCAIATALQLTLASASYSISEALHIYPLRTAAAAGEPQAWLASFRWEQNLTTTRRPHAHTYENSDAFPIGPLRLLHDVDAAHATVSLYRGTWDDDSWGSQPARSMAPPGLSVQAEILVRERRLLQRSPRLRWEMMLRQLSGLTCNALATGLNSDDDSAADAPIAALFSGRGRGDARGGTKRAWSTLSTASSGSRRRYLLRIGRVPFCTEALHSMILRQLPCEGSDALGALLSPSAARRALFESPFFGLEMTAVDSCVSDGNSSGSSKNAPGAASATGNDAPPCGITLVLNVNVVLRHTVTPLPAELNGRRTALFIKPSIWPRSMESWRAAAVHMTSIRRLLSGLPWTRITALDYNSDTLDRDQRTSAHPSAAIDVEDKPVIPIDMISRSLAREGITMMHHNPDDSRLGSFSDASWVLLGSITSDACVDTCSSAGYIRDANSSEGLYSSCPVPDPLHSGVYVYSHNSGDAAIRAKTTIYDGRVEPSVAAHTSANWGLDPSVTTPVYMPLRNVSSGMVILRSPGVSLRVIKQQRDRKQEQIRRFNLPPPLRSVDLDSYGAATFDTNIDGTDAVSQHIADSSGSELSAASTSTADGPLPMQPQHGESGAHTDHRMNTPLYPGVRIHRTIIEHSLGVGGILTTLTSTSETESFVAQGDCVEMSDITASSSCCSGTADTDFIVHLVSVLPWYVIPHQSLAAARPHSSFTAASAAALSSGFAIDWLPSKLSASNLLPPASAAAADDGSRAWRAHSAAASASEDSPLNFNFDSISQYSPLPLRRSQLTPAEDHGPPSVTLLSVPVSRSPAYTTYIWQPYHTPLLHAEDCPPDVHRGMDVPPAVLLTPVLIPAAVCARSPCASADGASDGTAACGCDHIDVAAVDVISLLSRYPSDGPLSTSGILLCNNTNNSSCCCAFTRSFSAPLLVEPLSPDFSMPFNVMTLVMTMMAFVAGTMLNVLGRRRRKVAQKK